LHFFVYYKKHPQNDSRTLFIGKIGLRDLEQSSVAQQLISQRLNAIRTVFESLGTIENYYDKILSGSYLLVTYSTHEEAEKVYKILTNKKELENINAEALKNFVQNKLPESVAPDFTRYKYDWSEKTVSNRQKNAISYQLKEDSTTNTTTTSSDNNTKTNDANNTHKEEKKKIKKLDEKKLEEKEETQTTQKTTKNHQKNNNNVNHTNNNNNKSEKKLKPPQQHKPPPQQQ